MLRLSFACGVVLLLLLAAAPSSHSQIVPEVPAYETIDGDWVVRTRETRSDTTVFVKGNITIEAGGSLELTHTRMVLGSPSESWQLPILTVHPGGTFKMLANAVGASTLTSNESWILFRINGTFESRGTDLHRNQIEWVWGEVAYDPQEEALVPALPDGGSRSGIRFDNNAVGTIVYTDVKQVAIRHFIVAQAKLTLEHVRLLGNTPSLSSVQVPLQGVCAARSSIVIMKDVTIEPVHTGVYAITPEKVTIEDSHIEGGVPLGNSGTSPVALQVKRGDVTVTRTTLKAPQNAVLVESNATVTVTDSTVEGYSSIGFAALGLKAGSGYAGSPDVTLRRVTFKPSAPLATQNGIQSVFGKRLVVEDSILSGHKGSGIVAVNTTTVLRGNEVRGNQEWGAWLHGGVLESESGNDLGSGTQANRLGKMLKDITLYVRVVDGSGRPISNATVKAFDRNGDEAFSDLTRGPNPDDPKGAEKEGWLLDSHYLLGFKRMNDGTTDNRMPYRLEASKKGFPTKTVVLDDLKWQRIGIALQGAAGETDPIVGGEVVENPFAPDEGLVEEHGHDHGEHGSGGHRLLDKVPGPGVAWLLLALVAAMLVRRTPRKG